MASSTTRLTVGAILGSVSTAANSVTTTLNTATTAIEMADKYMTASSVKLSKRLAADAQDYSSQIAVEKASEIAARQMQALEFCNQSPKHKELFEDNYNRIKALLDAIDDKG